MSTRRDAFMNDALESAIARATTEITERGTFSTRLEIVNTFSGARRSVPLRGDLPACVYPRAIRLALADLDDQGFDSGRHFCVATFPTNVIGSTARAVRIHVELRGVRTLAMFATFEGRVLTAWQPLTVPIADSFCPPSRMH